MRWLTIIDREYIPFVFVKPDDFAVSVHKAILMQS